MSAVAQALKKKGRETPPRKSIDPMAGRCDSRKSPGGFQQLAHWEICEMGRLQLSGTQILIVTWIRSLTEWCERGTGEACPKKTRQITTLELMAVTGCEAERTIEYALKDLRQGFVDKSGKQAGLVEVIDGEEDGRGYHFRCLPSKLWSTLAREKKKPMDTADSLDSNEPEEDEGTKGERKKLRLFSKERIAAHSGPRRVPIPIAATEYVVEEVTGGEIDMDAKVTTNGELRVRVHVYPETTRKNLRVVDPSDGKHSIDSPEFLMARDLLNRWFRLQLGPVDDAIVFQCLEGQGDASLEDCARRLNNRRSAIKTYGLVVQIFKDCGQAAGRSNRHHEKAFELSDEDVAWLERQKKKTDWKNGAHL